MEITEFMLERKTCEGFFEINFPPMRALAFITGHVIYNSVYTVTYKFQLKTTQGYRRLQQSLKPDQGPEYLEASREIARLLFCY